MRFTLIWIAKMRWWLLIVALIILAYWVGPPKDFSVLQWVKDLVKEAQ